jgi:hypothetical protein
MAPIEYIGRYMRGWFDFAIADELHQLAGDTAQGNGLGVLGRAAQRLIALTGLTTLLAAKQETDGFLLAYSVAGSCTVTENSEGEDLCLLGQVLSYHWQPTVTYVCFVHFPYQYRAR